MTKATLSEVTKPISPEINGPAKKVTATFTFTAVFSSNLLNENKITPINLTPEIILKELIEASQSEMRNRGGPTVEAMDLFKTLESWNMFDPAETDFEQEEDKVYSFDSDLEIELGPLS